MPTPRYFLVAILASFSITSAHAEKPTPKPQESFAAYWTAESGWDTDLRLRNNLAAGNLTVTPVLRLADGREIVLEAQTIPSNGSVSVPVGEALSKRAPGLLNQPTAFGSVAFRYTSLHARNLSVAVMVHMHGQPIGYHFDAYPVSKSDQPGSIEGIWWQPHPGTKNVLAFSNGSDKSVRGTLFLFDAAGKTWHKAIALAPHQTQRMSVATLVRTARLGGSYGGFKLELPSHALAIDSVHFLYDESVGFSALMKTFDHDPAAKLEERTWAGNKQWTAWAPMLALRTPDPAAGFPVGTTLEPTVMVRNTTANRTSATVSLSWRGDSGKGKAALPELSLSPFETRMLDIGAMQKQLQIPDDAHWALVTLTSPASPDDLIAIAASYDSTGRYGAQTPFSDNLGSYWSGGQWEVDSTHNALIAVTNGGSRPTDALLTIHYDNGRQKYEVQQTIAVGDQIWLNVAELIRNQVPDRKGRTLPSDPDCGHIRVGRSESRIRWEFDRRKSLAGQDLGTPRLRLHPVLRLLALSFSRYAGFRGRRGWRNLCVRNQQLHGHQRLRAEQLLCQDWRLVERQYSYG
ncbi:MAG TPA: hypothetical protein VI386_08985, partial [Candidatus Sulfotelmatobacter sp.]